MIVCELIFTDYDWSELSRPSLVVASNLKSAVFRMGGSHEGSIEIVGQSHADLTSQLQGLCDLFAAAAHRVQAESPV